MSFLYTESAVSPLGGDMRRESVKSQSSPLSTSDAQNSSGDNSKEQPTNVQQLPRESGDGASAVPSESFIESTNVTSSDGRRTLSTARNGSLFDDDDEVEDEPH